MARTANCQYVAMTGRKVMLTVAQEAALVEEARRAQVTVSQLVREAVWSWMVGRLAVARKEP